MSLDIDTSLLLGRVEAVSAHHTALELPVISDVVGCDGGVTGVLDVVSPHVCGESC